ncbi:MAG: hypothetical protein Q9221_006849 [Calogaya cf. arnoldii]
MLPSALQSSYKTYKEDTNTIANWLATKARQCGYSADLLDRNGSSDPSKAVQASKRLKGKARKKAQEALKSATTVTPEASKKAPDVEPPKYVIKVKEFISLAEYIVGSMKALVKVPTALVKVLDRAILLRKQFSSAAGESADPGEGHAYFLAILEKTREILKPHSASEVADDGLHKSGSETGPQEAQEQEDIANIFDNLDLEEPSQEFLDAPGTQPAPPTTKKEVRPKYEVETPQTREEEYLAAHCLLTDVRNIRAFVCALWTNYQEGMDLCAVSITVNTAIDFVRELELDMVRCFPAKTDYESIITIFYLAQSLHRGHNPEHKQQQGDLFNLAVYDLAEDIMLPTFSILSSLQDVIQNDPVPQYKSGYLGYRDRRTHWHQKSARDKIQDDHLVMMEAFPDLLLLSMMTSKMPLAEDELMRGVRQMSPDKDIPLWLVFAAQCFLDAQHELEGDISKGHDQLRTNADSIRTSIEQNLKFHEKLRIVNWPKENDRAFTDMLYVIDQWVGKDAVADKWQKLPRHAGEPAGEPFQLLRQYPVICGLFSFALAMRYQELQIMFVNAWGSLMYTGQLYNAVRQEKLIPQSKIWKDMEFLIMLQGPDKIFIGDRPTKLEDYLKRFLLSVGYSAAIFAKNRRKNVQAVSAKGPRQLTKLCAVGQLFAGRYCNNDAALAWTTEMMKPIIEAKFYDDSDDGEEEENRTSPPSKGNGGGKARKVRPTSKQGQESKTWKAKEVKQSKSGALLRKASRAGSAISTRDFLQDLANALHAETVEMSLDYLRIHRFCWMLLRRVHEICKPRLLETYGGGYLDREDQLPFVVGYIFMSATATSHIAGVLIPKKKGVEVTNRLLMTAAHPIEEMIDSGAGAIELKILEQRVPIDLDFGETLQDV